MTSEILESVDIETSVNEEELDTDFSFSDSEEEYFDAVNDHVRDPHKNIIIHKNWEWIYDWENFTFPLDNLTWTDVESLCACDLSYLRDKIDIESGFAGYYGTQKYINLKEKSSTRTFRVMNEDAGSFLFEVDGEPLVLFDDKEMVDMINDLWKAKTNTEFINLVKSKFPSSLARQCAIVFLLAFNNSILKAKRNQIIYRPVNVDLEEIAKN
jgi:hypothetical protein